MSTHQNHHVTSSTTSSSSFKSTTVSILSSEDLLTEQDNTNQIVITHNNPPSSQFTNLIETEKTLLHDEREPHTNNSDPVVVVTNTSVELTDDDEFECDREINQITNISNVGRASPEPSGNLELAGIRDGVVIRVGGDAEVGGSEIAEGVEFQEFCVGGEELSNVSSKSSKSKQISISKSVQSQSSVEKISSSSKNEVLSSESSANQIQSVVEIATPAAEPPVAMVKSEEPEEVKEGPKEKKTKVERKSSKAGGKKKGNAEISKENISVTSLTNGTYQQEDPRSKAPQPLLIPEDLAKKLGPGESRVFAKVCVANLRRSFGDLTALSIAAESSAFNKFSGSNSLEYNRINNCRDFKCKSDSSRSAAGHSSLPPSFCNRNNMSATNKLQLFQPSYWEGLLCSRSCNDKKSSFSKFDSLVAKNNSSSSSVAVEKDTNTTSSSAEEQSSKQEPKKMYCASCEKQVFQMELIRAEKKDWHKNCFRCVTCRKVLGVDTYQSHEQRLYCKPHFKELFQPKAVLDDGVDGEREKMRSSSAKPKLQLIICESQPKELPPDVVRASDTPSTGLEDIQIDVRSKFEMFEGLKEKQAGDKSPEPLVVKRSASVLAKLKKYENSLANGNTELEGVDDEDLHGVDGIELQSEEEEEDEGGNSVIKDEIRRKLKNPLQALNEIAHFKQMEQVRSKWEEGTFTRDQMNADSRKEELQKFRSRLCQGKSGQLKELYEKGVDTGGDTLSDERRAEIDELKSERARTFKEMFERGEVIRGEDEEEEDEKGLRNGVDLEVFEAGVARESKKIFEELDKKVVSEKEVVREEKKRMGRFTRGASKVGAQEVVSVASAGEIVRCLDKKDEPLVVNTAELSTKFKFFETYEDEIERKKKEGKREVFKRITPPREDGVVKTEKDYDETDGEQTYRDPDVVRHGENEQDDTLQKSRTTSKMLSVFRQMEENLSRGDGAKDPIIRPLKQFTPPRDTVGSNGRVVDSEEEEECEEEDEEEEGEEQEEEGRGEDDFLKEVGSLARARSLRAKFERWEQQENERNRSQGGQHQDELAESIESAKNLKAKFEAMRLMGGGDGSNKENGKGSSPLPIKVNRFV